MSLSDNNPPPIPTLANATLIPLLVIHQECPLSMRPCPVLPVLLTLTTATLLPPPLSLTPLLPGRLIPPSCMVHQTLLHHASYRFWRLTERLSPSMAGLALLILSGFLLSPTTLICLLSLHARSAPTSVASSRTLLTSYWIGMSSNHRTPVQGTRWYW